MKLPLARRMVYVSARVTFAVLALYMVLRGDYEAAFIAATGFVVSIFPQLVVQKLKLHLPVSYEIVVMGFIVASIMLGELFDIYEKYWWWDSVLHLSSGVIIGYIGFMILYVFRLQGKLTVGPGIIAFLVFSVSMMVASMWEVFEFAVDQVTGSRMQRHNFDTMKDIILAMLGSILASFVAYWHTRWPESSPLRRQLTKFARKNAHLITGRSR